MRYAGAMTTTTTTSLTVGDRVQVSCIGVATVTALPEWEAIEALGEVNLCGTVDMVTAAGDPFGLFVCGDDQLRRVS